MKPSLPAALFIGMILLSLTGCAAGSTPASTPASSAAPAGSPGAAANDSSSPAANSDSATHTGVPADVCTKLPLARVNQLTGWELTVVQAMETTGKNAAECHYSNSTNPSNTSQEIYALVMTGADSGPFWQQSRDSTTNGVADLPGVGKRAYSADGSVAVDYGNLVIIISDYSSTGGNLDVDQARFLVDELHNLYS